MRRWSLEARVGLVITLAIAFFVFLLLNAADWPWGGGKRRLKVTFHFVSDIQEGAPVFLSGVDVGKVRHVRLTPQGALIEASISDEEQPLRVGCKATITMLGLVGESVLSLENGPLDNPPLPDDAIIEGVDPINVMNMLHTAADTIEKAAGTMTDIQQILQQRDLQLASLLTETHQLVQASQRSLDQLSRDGHLLIAELRGIAEGRGSQLETTLETLETAIRQTQQSSHQLIAQLDATGRQLSLLVSTNEMAVQQTLDNFGIAAVRLREVSERLDEHIRHLSTRTETLLEQADDTLITLKPETERLIEDLGETNLQLQSLLASLDQATGNLTQGRGSLGKLLQEDSTIEAIETTLAQAQQTLDEVQQLTQSLQKPVEAFPPLRWDYQLHYRTDTRRLYTEANVGWGTRQWDYRLGIVRHASTFDWNALIGYHVGDLTLRGGFIRSKAALGLDYAFLSRRLRLTLEGQGIAASEPQLIMEAALQPLIHWELVGGLETPIRREVWDRADLSWYLGLRVNY